MRARPRQALRIDAMSERLDKRLGERPAERLGAEDVIRLLGLEPLEGEGGYFRRTWSSPASVGHRSLGSAIYYLLTSGPAGFSALHRLQTDEVYHFYRGDAVELHLFMEEGGYELRLLGPAFERGQFPQTVVPARSVQGLRLAPGGSWALLGTTMAPAFEAADFALVDAATLRTQHPGRSRLIDELTKK